MSSDIPTINMGTVKPCQISNQTVRISIPTDTHITAYIDHNPTDWFNISDISSYQLRKEPWNCDPNELSPTEMRKCLTAKAQGKKYREEWELVGRSNGSTPLYVTKDLVVKVGITFCAADKNLKLPLEAKNIWCELIIKGDNWQDPEKFYIDVIIDCPTQPDY
ncbi:hypothetical protein CN994_18495 [Bacillus anthracis]|nr:hypothetical protein CN994_18495 [Bacillus anthracis]